MAARRKRLSNPAPGKKGAFSAEPPEEEHIRTIRFISVANMDTHRETLAQFEQPGLEDLEISDENVRLIGSMKDGLQMWNAIVIVSHVKIIKGEKSLGCEMEEDVVAAIRDLAPESLSNAMAGKLRAIAESSPNDLARAAARHKLDEAGF